MKTQMRLWIRATRLAELAFVASALLGIAAPAAPAQTVDEIIAKNVAAQGGLEQLRAVHSLRTTGKVDAGFLRAEQVQTNKRPDKVREEIKVQGMTQVQAYDGKDGWQINPFGGRRDPERLSADDLRGLAVDADLDGPLVDYAAKGHKAEYMGHDPVEGTDCYKVKLTLKDGDIRTYYFDTDSSLLIKLETQTLIRGEVQESETYYGDYEKVNGLYYPFAVEAGQKGDPNRVKYTVVKIEANVPVDDALFTMPAAKTDAKAGAKPTGGAQ
jgi:hypothetical protein